MAIDSKISRKFPDNTVQVDVTAKKMPTRYFKLPEEKADSFVKSYNKYDSNTRTISTTLLLLLTLAGGIIGNKGARDFKAKPFWQYTISTICAMAGCFGSTLLTADIMQTKEAKLLKAHNAREISYEENKKFPI